MSFTGTLAHELRGTGPLEESNIDTLSAIKYNIIHDGARVGFRQQLTLSPCSKEQTTAAAASLQKRPLLAGHVSRASA